MWLLALLFSSITTTIPQYTHAQVISKAFDMDRATSCSEDTILTFSALPFDEGMLNENQSRALKQRYCIASPKTFALYKRLYAQNLVTNISSHSPYIIPPFIHFIWIGPRKLPSAAPNNIATWQHHNPCYEIKVWGEKEILTLTTLDKEYWKTVNNPAEQSDIARYHILLEQGGMYADIDTICYNSFDLLNKAYGFYASVEPLPKSLGIVGNAIIASAPHHPLITHIVQQLPMARTQPNILSRTGPTFLTHAITSYFDVDSSPRNLHDNDIIIFPSCVLYASDRAYNYTLQPSAYAEHLWYGTWRNL